MRIYNPLTLTTISYSFLPTNDIHKVGLTSPFSHAILESHLNTATARKLRRRRSG
jgi:hypothetical protein